MKGPFSLQTVGLSLVPLLLGLSLTRAGPAPYCDADNGGLVLPKGACARVVASHVGSVRQLTVSEGGDLYAAIASGSHGVLALRDTNGDGTPDQRTSFAPHGANDVELHAGFLYVSFKDRILRYRISPGQLKPAGTEEVVVSGLPGSSGHKAKSLAFGAAGEMYVSVGSATNNCQQEDRQERSPGKDPCTELEHRAGIWQFSAVRLGQRFEDGQRYATGLRNPLALTTHDGGKELYAAVHGRDQLGDNWGFNAEVNADNPAEELVQIKRGDDFGWPYCYYSNQYTQKVLAPEYGGDGQKVGRCSAAKDPLLAFPGHWAPLALAFYDADQFGSQYRGGLFVAFHGSWNRAPLPQAGYRVVFVPFSGGQPSGAYSTFAISREGPTTLRASGLAVGPDGSLYIAADDNEKIWKVSRATR